MEAKESRLKILKMLVVLELISFLRYLSSDDDLRNLRRASGEYMGSKYLSMRKYRSVLF